MSNFFRKAARTLCYGLAAVLLASQIANAKSDKYVNDELPAKERAKPFNPENSPYLLKMTPTERARYDRCMNAIEDFRKKARDTVGSGKSAPKLPNKEEAFGYCISSQSEMFLGILGINDPQ